MKYAVAPEHLEFFIQNHAIVFEDLLSDEEMRGMQRSIEEVVAERLAMPYNLAMLSPEQAFRKGRDLWRSHSALKKVVVSERLAGVAGELLGQRPLRLGYDQLYIGAQTPYFDRTASLKEISSLQGVVGGCILCLDGGEEMTEELFPTQAGSGLFVDASFPITFPKFTSHPRRRYLLIVYTHSMTAYIHKKDDPFTSDLTKWGYNIGDPLTNQKNPIVYR